MLSQNERITVLQVIGAVLRGATIPFPMDGMDYNSVFACGAAHGFGALLCRGLKEIYLPDGIVELYETRKAEFEQRRSCLSGLLRLLDTEGYKYMLLDGAALMGLYGEKYLRAGRDFNLLVEESERERLRYCLQKHGFSHIRESRGANFFAKGSTRFCIMSQDMAYDSKLDLWSIAARVNGIRSAYSLSPSDRYICALLKLKQRLDAGFGGVMQLIDIFVLKMAVGDRLNDEYIRRETERLGLGMTELRAEAVYRALFLDEKNIKYDDTFVEAVFRDVPTKLPEKYITPERRRFFKRLKIITAVVAVTATVTLAVCITLIIGDSTQNGDESVPDISEYTAQSRPVTEIETPYGYYNGEVDENNVPYGSGTLNYYNGDVYVGSFVNGKRHGTGKTTFKTGGSFEGEYVDDVISGSGVMTYQNGDVITGQFENNLPNGSCTAVYADGTSYEGDMRDGMREGKGRFVYSNGDVYDGEFKSDFRYGYGEYRYASGAVYKGNWIDGVQNGEGTFTDSLGTYTGSFSGGVFSGQGTYNYANGDVYVGSWSGGKPNGTGKLTGSGEVYEGGFVNGVISGNGQKTFANGDIVKGTFKNGKLSGVAQYYFKTYGYWRTVLYEDGKLVKYLDEN